MQTVFEWEQSVHADYVSDDTKSPKAIEQFLYHTLADVDTEQIPA